MNVLSRGVHFFMSFLFKGNKKMEMNFSQFLSHWRDLDEVHYVPYLEDHDVLNDIEELDRNLVACWQFETDCTGDVCNVGTNNGNYIEITTVRVYDSGDKRGDHVLVTSKYISDFHDASAVEMWEKIVPPQKIFEILEELEKTQQELYSR